METAAERIDALCANIRRNLDILETIQKDTRDKLISMNNQLDHLGILTDVIQDTLRNNKN